MIEEMSEEGKAVEEQWKAMIAQSAKIPKTKKQLRNEYIADLTDFLDDAIYTMTKLRDKLESGELFND